MNIKVFGKEILKDTDKNVVEIGDSVLRKMRIDISKSQNKKEVFCFLDFSSLITNKNLSENLEEKIKKYVISQLENEFEIELDSDNNIFTVLLSSELDLRNLRKDIIHSGFLIYISPRVLTKILNTEVCFNREITSKEFKTQLPIKVVSYIYPDSFYRLTDEERAFNSGNVKKIEFEILDSFCLLGKKYIDVK